ncbi:MAG: SDR family NAD(P)-dependent oxidoreductase [Dehalococcoidales bacterium]|nr:SDR family NAD(P)-dependent oxidoreductase [Dehalococcoidales bacterium]
MAESRELRGKVVLVTGASRGIGLAVALDLAAAGAVVIGTARPSADLDTLGRKLAERDAQGFVVPADVREEASVTALLSAIEARVGRVDVLINNAGIARKEPLSSATLESWRDVFSTNVDSVFLLTQPVVRRMLRRGSGHLVFIASDAAVRGISEMTAYCASKHAVLGFGRALAAELSDTAIRVTVILPGGVNTTILRKEASREDLLQPEDVATTVHYALSMPARAVVRELLIVPTQKGVPLP